jgi:hypothetical protein
VAALEPVAGRACGDCTGCCTELTIDDPALRKPDGVGCRHLCGVEQGGPCGIYDSRPATCRDWFCGWRLLSSLNEAMRPDRSGVLISPDIDTTHSQTGGLTLMPLSDDVSGLFADELIDLTGKCVARGVPMFIAIGHGANCKRLFLNPILEFAAKAGDRADFVACLRTATDELVQAVAAAASPRRWSAPPFSIRIPAADS